MTTVLSRAYFSLFHVHQEKLLDIIVELKNTAEDKLNSSEQKDWIEDIEIIQKRHNLAHFNNISFII